MEPTMLSRVARYLSLGYRAIASIIGMTVLFALADGATARPSDVVHAIARWAGVDIVSELATWTSWIAAPERAEMLAQTCAALVWVGLAYVMISAQHDRTPFSRPACLTWIAFGMYLEAAEQVSVAFWAVVATGFLLWCMWSVRQDDDRAPLIALIDLVATVLWLPVLMFAYAVSSPPPSDREKHVRTAPASRLQTATAPADAA